MFFRVTTKARQYIVSPASPPQLGPSGKLLFGSSRKVNSKSLAGGNNCGNGFPDVTRGENHMASTTASTATENQRIAIFPFTTTLLLGD
jgi:hypothetical protein